MAGMLLDVLTNGGSSVTTTTVPVSNTPNGAFSGAPSPASARTRPLRPACRHPRTSAGGGTAQRTDAPFA